MIETKKISVKTLSPIHIKGKEYNYGEGFVRKDYSSVYTLDLGKLFGFLLDKFPGGDKLLINYNNSIESAVIENKIKEFDNEKFLSDNNIYHYQKNKTLEKQLIESGAFSSIVYLTGENEFIKDGMGRPYIPGSSVKGAIRTAILYNAIKYYFDKNINNEAIQIIKNINNHLDDLSNELSKKKNEREKQKLKKEFLSELELIVLQTKEHRATKDFLRCIKIKDSQFLEKLQKKEVFVTNAKKSFSNSNITPETESIGEIRLMFGKPIVKTKDKILSISKKMLKDKVNLLINNEGKSIIIKEYDKEFILDFDLILDSNFSYSLVIKSDENKNETKETIEIFDDVTQLEIALDKQIYNSLIDNYQFIDFVDLDGLLKNVNSFYREVWEFEKKFFDNINDTNLNCESIRTFYNNYQENIMRVGWGSGLPAISLFLLFDEDIKKKLRNIIFKDERDFVATKSRRLIFENNQPKSPLGWLQFSEVKNGQL
jgi:CRISPR-associated protein Csm5